MRPAVLALAASALGALACTSADTPSCPGTPVAVFRLKGPLVAQGDPLVAALDPVPEVPDCTPDPLDPTAPIRYPHLLPPFEARLAADPATGAAALCRSNGIVYSGQRTGAEHSRVEADAEPAVLCSACAASLQVVVEGDVVLDAGGTATAFRNAILVEKLTELRGVCDGCLPLVPDAAPAQRACAARYALEGRVR